MDGGTTAVYAARRERQLAPNKEYRKRRDRPPETASCSLTRRRRRLSCFDPAVSRSPARKAAASERLAMTGDQLLSDDESGWRDGVRRLASLLLKIAVLAGLVAGGVWAFARLELRRASHERTAAVHRLTSTGVVAGWTGEQCVSARFDRPADDEALAALSWSTTVREVEAPFSKLSNDGLKHLAKLRDLESLDLSGATIDGRALAHLKGLRSLRYLTLDGTGVTDEGLEPLRELPALQYLSLGGHAGHRRRAGEAPRPAAAPQSLAGLHLGDARRGRRVCPFPPAHTGRSEGFAGGQRTDQAPMSKAEPKRTRAGPKAPTAPREPNV